MATTVPIDEADLPQLVQRVRAGEDILFAEGGKPVARLVLVEPATTEPAPAPASGPAADVRRGRVLTFDELFPEGATPKRPDMFGFYAGKASIGPEFFDPLPEEELRLWEGGDAEEDGGPRGR